MTRRAATGLALAGAYLLVAAGTFAVRLLPRCCPSSFPILDDGAGAPPPYQWVHPPPARAGNNIRPASVTATVVLTYAALATTVYRRDGQAWTGLSATPASSSQVFAGTTGLGIFVVAAAPEPVPGGARGAAALEIGGVVLAAVAIVVAAAPEPVPGGARGAAALEIGGVVLAAVAIVLVALARRWRGALRAWRGGDPAP